ncbi:MAG: hypothetical protein JKY43_11655, partial [Phycisphaerales bacterium]|nr:hypothetical protein [Phycisphaerales bacterium]
TPTTPFTATATATLNGNKAETIVEPHSLNSRAALPTNEDMFLSPRVMDAGTFARYSEMLKSIIAQSTTQGRTLEDFSADAEEMIRRSGESVTTLDKRLQAGVRMLRMIDERVDRTDKVLDKVRDILPDAESMRLQYETMMNDTLDKAQKQLDGMVRDADIRAQAAEQRARVAMQRADDQTIKLEAINSDLDMRMSAIELRMVEAETQSGQTIGLIDRRLVSFQEELSSQVDQVIEQANKSTADIEERVINASRITEERVIALGKSIEPLQSAAEQAMRSLGIDPENPRFEDSPLAKIESLVERGESHIAGVDRLLRQLDELRNQTEGVKGEFGMWLLDSATKLDQLEARKDLLDGPIHNAAVRIREIGPDLQDKLELASNKLEHLSTQSAELKDSINFSSTVAERATDKLVNQTAQIQALLDGSLHSLTQRVEQAGVWLGSLITQAQQAGRDLGVPESDASNEVLRSVEEIQSKVLELNKPIDAVSLIQPAVQPTAQPTAQPAIIPNRCHIDSISFDGASVVIEYDDGTQGAD